MDENTIQKFGVFREAPGNESTSDLRITRTSPFPINPATVAISATKHTQPTGMADGCGESPTGNEVHGREQDRMLDAEYLCQTIANRHLFLLRRW